MWRRMGYPSGPLGRVALRPLEDGRGRSPCDTRQYQHHGSRRRGTSMGGIVRRAVPRTLGRTRRVLSALMCPPTHYTVCYSINPWMKTDVRVDRGAALRQWMTLVAALEAGGVEIALIKQAPSLPDMVFISYAGFFLQKKKLLTRIGPSEPRGEEAPFALWFVQHG